MLLLIETLPVKGLDMSCSFYYHFPYFILIEKQSKLENNTNVICVNALELCDEYVVI